MAYCGPQIRPWFTDEGKYGTGWAEEQPGDGPELYDALLRQGDVGAENCNQ